MISGALLLLFSILIFIAILVTKVGARFGVPTLLLFLLLGMLLGPDGLGIKFEDHELAQHFGHLAMTIILFTAGLQTSLKETRPVMRPGILLSSVGILLTILITGGFIMLCFGASFHYAVLGPFLLAAILSPTDSHTVHSILHSRRLRLREGLAPMIDLESGSNDPMGLSITLILVQILSKSQELASRPGTALLIAFLLLVLQIGVGVGVGFAVGYGARWLLKRVKVPGNTLNAIFLLSIGLFANGLADILHGNDLLAIYIAALLISNRADLRGRKEVNSFFDGITWLMQLGMFLMLGLLARPNRMLPTLLPAVAVGLILIFVARPASVLLTLLPFRKVSFRAKLFTSWVGIKGTGPILFALFPIVAGLEGAPDILNIVFVITLLSLVLQGMTLRPLARALRLSYEEDPRVETFGMEIPEEMGMLRDHTVTEDDLAQGATLRDLALPHGIRVVMVRRGERFLVPHGSMALEAGDRLVIIMGESDD